MQKPYFTPGPWEVIKTEEREYESGGDYNNPPPLHTGYSYSVRLDRSTSVYFHNKFEHVPSEFHATPSPHLYELCGNNYNAYLIAAAPELYEALRTIMNGITEDSVRKAIAALNKAINLK